MITVDKVGVDEMGVDEIGSRRNVNKPFSLAAYYFETCFLSLYICNKLKYLSVYLCTNCA